MSGMNSRMLILASSSPRRKELIRTLGLPVTVIASDADETVPDHWEPQRIVEELALRKALAVAEGRNGVEDGIVIGSDTIVVLDGRVLGKPKDERDAERTLKALQGREHQVYSGVASIDLKGGKTLTREGNDPYTGTGEPMDNAGGHDTAVHIGDNIRYRILSQMPGGEPEIIVGHTVSKVSFRPMSDEEIEAYIKTGDPLDKAGSYGIQGLGSVFIEKIEGDFYSIMGLPLNLLYEMLLRSGISPFSA